MSLLCTNCHREIHEETWHEDDIKKIVLKKQLRIVG